MLSVSSPFRRMSAEEYLRLPEDFFRCELIRGVVRVPPSPLFRHQDSQGQFFYRLRLYLERHAVGRVVTETDVILDPRTVLCPDVLFVSREREHIIRDHIYGAPDLVCEVLSKRTRQRDMLVKSEIYLRHGVREYWLIDPAARSRSLEVRVRLDGPQPAWRSVSGPVLASRLLPGFEVRAEQIFGDS